MEGAVMEEVWRREGASPERIEAALRQMIWRRADTDEGSRPWLVPPRVLNLVVIVDADLRGAIENRLRSAGRLQPSRLVVCSVQEGCRGIVASAGVGVDDAGNVPGRIALAYERVEITVGPQHLSTLDTIVDLLLVPELTTLVWSPHAHDEGVDALRRLAQAVVFDSQDGPDAVTTLARATELAHDSYVIDLAWLRSTPWRERVAALFDPTDMRPELDAIADVTVRHREDSLAAALLFGGWLCSRLRWRPSRLAGAPGALSGDAESTQRDVGIHLQAVEMQPPGLDGVTIELASGAAVSFDRAPGGMRTTRRRARGSERVGTLFGASRGEVGILGEAMRQSLLRDPTYRPALRCAGLMV
jgi:glucose-6-phosphate dehydrogenase assembly protein OpcA